MMLWLLLALLLLPSAAVGQTKWGVGPCLMPAAAGNVNDVLAIASLTPCQLGFTAGGGGGPVFASGTLTNHAPIIGQGGSTIKAIGTLDNGWLMIGSTGADPIASAFNTNTLTITTGPGLLLVDSTPITAHATLLGNAAGPYTSVGPCSSGQLQIGSTGANPVCAFIASGSNINIAYAAGSIVISASAAGTVTGSGTTNTLPKWTGASALGDSLLTDNATTLSYSGTGGISAAGAGPGILDMTEGAPPALSAAGHGVIYADSGSHTLKCSSNGSAYATCFSTDAVTSTGTLTTNAFVLGAGAKTVSAIALTGLVKGNGASTPTAYAGTTCSAGTFVNALDANGASTCATPVGTGGNVNASATLTNNLLVLGQGSTNVAVLATGFGVLHAGTPPTWASVSLLNDVTGRVQATNFPALTGDVTTPGGSLATTLSLTGVAAGTYNSVTVDTKGRVTAGSSSGATTGIQTSTFAALPAPGTVGAARYVTDTIRGLFFDNGTAWVPQGATSPAVRYLSVVTDASLASAVSQLPSTGGTIVIPAGTFAMSGGTITIPIPVVIQCQGPAGAASGSLTNFGGFSFTGATTTGRVAVLDCGLALAAGATGIRVTSSSEIVGAIFSRNIITGGAIAIDIVSNAIQNKIVDNHFVGQTTANVRLANAASPGRGDNVIANNQMECGSCPAALDITTASGNRIIGNKFIGSPQFNIRSVATNEGEMQVLGNSLTTATSAAIGFAGPHSGIDIAGNLFEPTSGGTMINFDGTGMGVSIARVAISGNHFRPSGAGLGINILGNTQNMSIVGNEFFGIPGANFISASGTQTTVFVAQNQWSSAGTPPFFGANMTITDNIGIPFAQLLAWNDGSVVFCSDCNAGSDPCTGGNSGAIAKRYNDNAAGSAWHCQK